MSRGGAEDLVGRQFDPSDSGTCAQVEGVFLERTRKEWREFAAEHECCLEPVLELDEALDSELVRAREMVVAVDQPGVERPVRLLGAPVKMSRTPAEPRSPGPALGEHTAEVLAGLGYSEREIAALEEAGAVAGQGGAAQSSFLA